MGEVAGVEEPPGPQGNVVFRDRKGTFCQCVPSREMGPIPTAALVLLWRAN